MSELQTEHFLQKSQRRKGRKRERLGFLFSPLLRFVHRSARSSHVHSIFAAYVQVLAYVILSASSASSQVAWLSEQGNSGYGWMKICNLYGKFCKQVGAGLIAAFLAFLGLLFSSGISSFILFAADPQD
jgi:uncharacterized protein (TIGR01569 family)